MTITLVMLALATLLALGYTLYLVYIETSTDLPPRHQSLHPTTVFMDVPFRTPRSPPYRRNRELESTSRGLHNGPSPAVELLTVPTITKMENESGTP
jgi:hypothetical protein